ncbi:MAG: flavodoxin [Myxococcota bacterium]
MNQSIGIFYGSCTGNTEMAAEKIRERLGGVVHMEDVAVAEPRDLESFDILLLGVSTWNIGEMQDDWDEFIPRMKGLDLSGKKIAIFAMGDAVGYPYNFLDAMGQLWKVLEGLGSPLLVGAWPTEGYDFEESEGLLDDEHFVGLGLDEDNQPELNDQRIEAWLRKVMLECANEEVA